ncbi:VOC family protein [Cumulibacter soli]|uniref:VOC family protein n=1 Tax=Cumulibacter soli TaxID=2546344 RepID=UPI0010674519|nr:VOC family protein [Cumulibacter soli]
MRMRLRQVALVAADLGPVEREIEQQLGVELCYRDPGVGHFGLRNALYPVGDKLLEVVSPTEDGTTAGRLLDKRGGDGGYMVILQVDDLDALKSSFEPNGVRVVHVARGAGIEGIHLHPRDVGGAILSVDRTEDWGEWAWAGPDWKNHIKSNVVTDLVAVEIQADDPAAMAARWAQVLGRSAVAEGDAHVIALDEGAIRFVTLADDRGEGVSAIDVQSADGSTSTSMICGTRVNRVA